MGTELHRSLYFKLPREKVVIIENTGSIISINGFILGCYACIVGDGLWALSGKMPVPRKVAPNGVRLLDFPTREVEVVVRSLPGDLWLLHTSAWRVRTGTLVVITCIAEIE